MNVSTTNASGADLLRCIRMQGFCNRPRALEKTAYFRQTYRQRVVVEHRIARLVGLGLRQSRYFGRTKTQFQALLAATVANLTLIANWLDTEGSVSDFWRSCCVTVADKAFVVVVAAIIRPNLKIAPI